MSLICKGETTAKRRYQQDMLKIAAAYMVVLFCSAWFVKHDGGERFYRYFWSLLPAIPVVAMIFRMGRYLREETDEYQRLLTMNAILVGAGSMLVVVLVDDFLRSFAGGPDLPAFTAFLVFCLGMAVVQVVQKMRNRAPADE